MRSDLILLDMTINYLQLIMVPVFIVTAIAGWMRGWREEAITAVGLLLSLLFFANDAGANIFALLINRITDAFRLFISVLFGGGGGQLDSTPTISGDNFRTFQTVSFILAVILSYIVGSAIGKRSGVSRLGQLMGAGIGVINAYIVLSKLYDFWLIRREQGNGLGLDEGTAIIITPAPATNDLKSNLPTIFAILFLLVLIVTFIRLPKIRQ